MKRVCFAPAALLAGLLLAAPAAAQDTDLDLDTDLGMDLRVIRLVDGLRDELRLTDKEADGLRPLVREHLERGGHGEEVRGLVRDALARDCRGTCLAEAVRSLNRMTRAGMAPEEARRVVGDELRAAADEGDGAGLEERLRRRIDARGERMREQREERREDLRERRRDAREEQSGNPGAPPRRR